MIFAPSLVLNIFRYQNFSGTQKGSPTKFFGTVREKIFDGKSRYFLPHLIQNFSIPEISETLKRSPTKFFGSETKKFRQKIENRDITLRSIKIFDTRNQWNTKGFPYEVFRYPLSSSIKLFEGKNFLENSRISLRKFSALRDLKISTENRDTRPLIHKFFFDTRKLPENRRVPLQSFPFRSCETKNFDKTKMPPFLCMKVFDKRSFLKHQSVLQWNISVQWDKNFDGKSWYPSPPLIHNIFPYQKFSETQNGSLAKFFRSCEIKKISTKLWSFPPLLLENFRYQNSFETQKGSPTNFIGTVRQKFFNGV